MANMDITILSHMVRKISYVLYRKTKFHIIYGFRYYYFCHKHRANCSQQPHGQPHGQEPQLSQVINNNFHRKLVTLMIFLNSSLRFLTYHLMTKLPPPVPPLLQLPVPVQIVKLLGQGCEIKENINSVF